MLFNSLDFAFFFPIVFTIYWLLNKNLKAQNIFILISSYLFYGWWDWRFLFLIAFSTIVDFTVGIKLSKEEDCLKRKVLLWTSIVVNIGLLGFFKYFNFFQENFVAAFTIFGTNIKGNSLNIILPVGISFYTFQTLSYTIDIYKRKLKATNDFISFTAFVSFFPQLVAGPIERASNLLPQFYRRRKFEYSTAIDGVYQIIWGLFKKMVIADNCAHYANMIFNNQADYSGFALVLGAIFFAFQIYGDFSGYSDIAIGASRLLGFDLMKNFAFPYFARDIAEFWRRWHISLSTWFRDYVYIPLGGSRGSTFLKIRNTFIIFIVSGFWHGANWTFVIWGGLHALYFLPLLLTKRNRIHVSPTAENRILPSPKEFLSILLTFSMSAFAWIFFRAQSLDSAMDYISGIFSANFFDLPYELSFRTIQQMLYILFSFIIIEWIGRDKEYGFQYFVSKPKFVVIIAAYIVLAIIALYMPLEVQEFIYFQF